MQGLFYEKNKALIITASVILVMFAAVYIIRPSIIGYIAYQKVKTLNYSIDDYGKDMQELKTSLLVSNANLSACGEFNKKLLPEFEKYLDKLAECKNQMNDLAINFSLRANSYEEEIKSLKQDLDEKGRYIKGAVDEKNKKIEDLSAQYSSLAQNTANNLCCKAKIDNPKIKYYRAENNRVICLEDGELSISC